MRVRSRRRGSCLCSRGPQAPAIRASLRQLTSVGARGLDSSLAIVESAATSESAMLRNAHPSRARPHLAVVHQHGYASPGSLGLSMRSCRQGRWASRLREVPW